MYIFFLYLNKYMRSDRWPTGPTSDPVTRDLDRVGFNNYGYKYFFGMDYIFEDRGPFVVCWCLVVAAKD